MRRSSGITMDCVHAQSPVIVPREGGTVVSTPEVPRTIRIAGLLTSLQALAGFAFVIALLVRSTSPELGTVGTLGRNAVYGEAGWFGLISAGVLAAGLGLCFGKHWARTPALLLQLLLLGAAWYAMGPSDAPGVAFAIAVPAVVVLWLLFNRQGRTWSFYAVAAPDADMPER